MTPIIKYLVSGELILDKNEAQALRRWAYHYAFKFEKLYKRAFLAPLLKCITPKHSLYVMQEIHEGVCGNHLGPRSLLHKVVKQGYYWSNMVKDTKEYVQACKPCQKFSRLTYQPAKLLIYFFKPLAFCKVGCRSNRTTSSRQIQDEICYNGDRLLN